MDALAGFLQLPFSFLDVSLALSSFRPRFRLNKAMMVQEKRGESWRAEMGEQRRAGAAPEQRSRRPSPAESASAYVSAVTQSSHPFHRPLKQPPPAAACCENGQDIQTTANSGNKFQHAQVRVLAACRPVLILRCERRAAYLLALC